MAEIFFLVCHRLLMPPPQCLWIIVFSAVSVAEEAASDKTTFVSCITAQLCTLCQLGKLRKKSWRHLHNWSWSLSLVGTGIRCDKRQGGAHNIVLLPGEYEVYSSWAKPENFTLSSVLATWILTRESWQNWTTLLTNPSSQTRRWNVHSGMTSSLFGDSVRTKPSCLMEEASTSPRRQCLACQMPRLMVSERVQEQGKDLGRHQLVTSDVR